MELMNKSSIKPRGEFRDRIKFKTVNENKSPAHIKLAEFEEQLQVTDKKCKFMKNRLDYMKMVCQSVEPARLETSFDIASHHSSKSILMNNREIFHNNIPENIRKTGNMESLIDVNAGNSIHSDHQKNKMLNYFRMNEVDKKLKKSLKEEKESEKIASEKYSSSDCDVDNVEDEMDPHEIFMVSPVTRKNNRKPELILKISNTRSPILNKNKIRKTNKSSKVLSTDTNFMDNSKLEHNKVDNTSNGRTVKFRKRKPRMRRTISKGTAAGRSVIIPQEYQLETKIKRNVNPPNEKSLIESNDVVTDNISDEKKPVPGLNDIVEIYHNTAAINTSPSAVSSKQQFQLEELKNYESKVESTTLINIDIEASGNNAIYPAVANERDEKNLHSEKKSNICQPFDQHKEMCRNNGGHEELDVNDPCRNDQHQSTFRPWCYDPFATKSYQQPTISSKLKKVQRCYFAAHVNLQNIPFVVGTSVTRSYNLGLNIQQTFSLIKHRQLSMSSNIRPMLIRKVGEGINPMIPLVEQLINNPNSEQTVTSSKQILRQDTQYTGGHSGVSKTRNYHGDTTEIPMHVTQSFMLRQREEELNMGGDDMNRYQSVTDNSTRIRNVLHRLRDEFEAMNAKYDKLQMQVQKTNDSSLQKELEELDNELTAKEEEIEAVMDLYKEIGVLKQQMKRFREKNSVVCITTRSNGKHSTRLGASMSARRQRTPCQRFQYFERPKLTTANGTREPMAATRLVGLLRQLQSFQQQFTAS